MNLSTDKSKLVSVIIPCYNMGRFIGEALESVAAQTHGNWEVLAVDDCGPEDGTREAIEAFAAQHPDHRIECIRHETNQGVSAARNTAIAAAKGRLLAFLDPDDAWLPHHLERHIAHHTSEDVLVVSASWMKVFDDAGNADDQSIVGFTRREIDVFPHSLVIRNGINPSAVVMPKGLIDEVGGFVTKPELQHVEDWDLWLRLTSGGHAFTFIEESTASYRRHDDAATADRTAMLRRIQSLREEHRALWSDYTAELLAMLMNKVAELEGVTKSLQGSIAVRVSRWVSKLLRRS